MTFSQYAGVAIVPTLARLVLAAVFLFQGYNKLFTRSDFEATADGAGAANKLHDWGVDLTPKTKPAPSTAFANRSWKIQPAANRQVETAESAPPPSQPDSPPNPTEATPPSTTPPSTSLAPGTYTAPTLYQIALLVNSANWKYPVPLAWLAALTEFVGGGMLLIGLFSRIWGLAIAGVMGVAFYFTSLPALQNQGFLNLGHTESTTLFFQTALFVLALGVSLTGAGPLSLDRLLFTRTATIEGEKQTTEVRRTTIRE